MSGLLSRTPEPLKRLLRPAYRAATKLLFGRRRYCPVCRSPASRFAPFGDPPRSEARCPTCGSLERHRLAWIYLTTRSDLFRSGPKRMLHIAPEPCLEPRLRERLGTGYLTGDLESGRAMARIDITEIRYPAASFDVIFCSHVLEHVQEDRRAMREFSRVLAPTGWALLMVPITAAQTLEDPSITDPADRLRVFGQVDHVRRYGPDFLDRLREAGFQVATVGARDLVSGRRAKRMRLPKSASEIFVCTKLAP